MWKNHLCLRGTLLLIVMMTGCAALRNAQDDKPIAEMNESLASDSKKPCYLIEVRAYEEGRKAERMRVEHTGKAFLQEALDKADATKRFDAMEIVIYRKDPRTGAQQRMGAKYDEENRRLPMRFDYALHPGDIVMITETPVTPARGILSKLSALRKRAFH